MDVVMLSRIQFGLTAAFHFIFPPLSIGLGMFLVLMEGLYLKTKNPIYETMTRFWVKIFALIFSVGVASGIVLEFEFGTNWATYARYVGDIFGSPLAIEGLFAFFLESCFLAILVFGWERVSPKMHFFSTVMVSLGSIFSAIWILVANSWMQTPAGYEIVQEGGQVRAVITDFWAAVFNPSTVDRLVHVLVGSAETAAFFVVAVGAYYLLKKRHLEFARATMKIGIIGALITSLLQLGTGHMSSHGISKYQPLKLAAAEGHFEKEAPATLYILGWVDEENQKVIGIGIPGMVGFLLSGDFDMPVKGLNSFKKEEWPPVNIVFQTYHGMVGIGMLLILISMIGTFLWKKGTLSENRFMLWVLVFSALGPHIANELGWMTAEIGRQPWIVYNLMKTVDGVSKSITVGQVWASLILFTLIYAVLFCLFIFLLFQKIKMGPEEGALHEERK